MELKDTVCRCGCGATVKPGHRVLSGSHLRGRLTPEQRFWLNVDRDDGPDACWIWAGAARTQARRPGYEYGIIMIDGVTIYAHRWAYERASGVTLTDEIDIGHVCDRGRCVRNDTVGSYEIEGRVVPRYGHLFAGTTADNMRDMIQKGRGRRGPLPPEKTPRGERAGRAKLTDDDVREIRRLRATGWTLQRLADRYGVSTHTISMICLRRNWQHID